MWKYKGKNLFVILSSHTVEECEEILRRMDTEEYDNYYPENSTVFTKKNYTSEDDLVCTGKYEIDVCRTIKYFFDRGICLAYFN